MMQSVASVLFLVGSSIPFGDGLLFSVLVIDPVDVDFCSRKVHVKLTQIRKWVLKDIKENPNGSKFVSELC
jgi:hypothetical protein